MNPFEYVRAGSVQDAVSKSSQPGARFLAGGTNLLDLMKYGVESGSLLIDVSELPLDKVETLPHGGLRIGAAVKNSDLAQHPAVLRDYPMLSQALLNGASPQLRNMATTGGNLLQRTRCGYFYDVAFPCNKRQPGSGCPAFKGFNRMHAILGQSEQCIAVNPSDMSVALRALDAVINVQGPSGARQIPIAEFHRLPADHPETDTTLAPGELIVSVELTPSASSRHSSYLKIRDRQSYAFALVSVAAGLAKKGSSISEARIALGGVAHKPWRKEEAEQALIGKPATRENFEVAAGILLDGAVGYEHNRFKIELAKRAVARSLESLEGMV